LPSLSKLNLPAYNIAVTVRVDSPVGRESLKLCGDFSPLLISLVALTKLSNVTYPYPFYPEKLPSLSGVYFI
jgi:hypothetical protein